MTSAEEVPPARTAGAKVLLLASAWLWVTAPFLYGLYELVLTSRTLFVK